MDFEKLLPGCWATPDAVQWSDGEFVRLVATKDSGAWELTEYGKTISALANMSTDTVELPKKRGKKPAESTVNDLDLGDL